MYNMCALFCTESLSTLFSQLCTKELEATDFNKPVLAIKISFSHPYRASQQNSLPCLLTQLQLPPIKHLREKILLSLCLLS